MFTQINDTNLKSTNGGAYMTPEGEVVVTAPKGMLGNTAPQGVGETREITLRDGTTQLVGVNTMLRAASGDRGGMHLRWRPAGANGARTGLCPDC